MVRSFTSRLTNLTSNLATKKQNKTNVVLVHQFVIAHIQVLKSVTDQLLKAEQNKENDLISIAIATFLVVWFLV
jgi:hypothetical protein